MKTEEKFLLLTHVASQLLGRWFPPPKLAIHKLYGSAISGNPSFRELIERDPVDQDPSFPWLWSYVNSGKLTVSRLVEAAEKHVDLVMRDGGHLIFIDSPLYPARLRFINRPPLVLSALGDLDSLSRRGIGVIGSRQATYESLRASVTVGRDLARAGYSVISGGAIGCDIAAHEGVLLDPGSAKAVVVFAGGLASRFPRCNESTFNSILERGGLLLSERLWFQAVMPYDFAARNRLISGLSEAVVVMCASLKSGTMLTAREALEQGRDVFVFAGDDGSDVRMEGSGHLSRDGALVFNTSDELLGFLDGGEPVDGNFSGSSCLWWEGFGRFNIELQNI